jgi:tetrahydromethanopterin S-methyltransferase subunit F
MNQPKKEENHRPLTITDIFKQVELIKRQQSLQMGRDSARISASGEHKVQLGKRKIPAS